MENQEIVDCLLKQSELLNKQVTAVDGVLSKLNRPSERTNNEITPILKEVSESLDHCLERIVSLADRIKEGE